MEAHTKIAPCLWFDFNAEEAVEFYLGLFPDSRILQVSRYGDGDPEVAGRVLMIWFELAGVQLQALNGGPSFKFTEAVSMSIACDDQREIDGLWAELSRGGSTNHCGWVKDRFGLSWQIVPRQLAGLLDAAQPERTARVQKALFAMDKIDLAGLQQAAA